MARVSVGRGPPVLAAHDVLAQRAVRREVGRRPARAAPPATPGQVLADAWTSPTPRRSRRAGRLSFCCQAARSSARTGATEMPSWPSTSSVMPWRSFMGSVGVGQHLEVGVAVGVDEAGRHDVRRSSRRLAAGEAAATAAMRAPSIATSASKAAAPDPSTTVPPFRTMAEHGI